MLLAIPDLLPFYSNSVVTCYQTLWVLQGQNVPSTGHSLVAIFCSPLDGWRKSVWLHTSLVGPYSWSQGNTIRTTHRASWLEFRNPVIWRCFSTGYDMYLSQTWTNLNFTLRWWHLQRTILIVMNIPYEINYFLSFATIAPNVTLLFCGHNRQRSHFDSVLYEDVGQPAR